MRNSPKIGKKLLVEQPIEQSDPPVRAPSNRAPNLSILTAARQARTADSPTGTNPHTRITPAGLQPFLQRLANTLSRHRQFVLQMGIVPRPLRPIQQLPRHIAQPSAILSLRRPQPIQPRPQLPQLLLPPRPWAAAAPAPDTHSSPNKVPPFQGVRLRAAAQTHSAPCPSGAWYRPHCDRVPSHAAAASSSRHPSHVPATRSPQPLDANDETSASVAGRLGPSPRRVALRAGAFAPPRPSRGQPAWHPFLRRALLPSWPHASLHFLAGAFFAACFSPACFAAFLRRL